MVNIHYPVVAAVNATAQTVLIALAGAVLCWVKVRTRQVIDDKGGSLLGRMTIVLFLPSLIFTNLISDLNDNNIDVFFEVLLYTTLHVVIGLAIGWSLGFLARANSDMRRVIALTAAFQNTTAVPLLFVHTLSQNGVTSADPDFGSKGTMYVLLFTVFTSFFKWTVAYRLMVKTPPKPRLTESLAVDMKEMPVGSEINTQDVEEDQPPKMTVWMTIKKTLNPPIFAVIIALPLALIPDVSKTLFLSGGAVFKENFFDAAKSVGQVTSVTTLLILGISLSKGYPPGANITKVEMACAVCARLIIMPLIGMALFFGLYHLGFAVICTQNRIMTMTMLLIFACPTSMQLLIISVQQKNQTENIAKMYLFVYLTALPTMALFTILWLAMLYE